MLGWIAMHDRTRYGAGSAEEEGPRPDSISPGKRTLTQSLAPRSDAVAASMIEQLGLGGVQRKEGDPAASLDGAAAQRIAASGFSGSGSAPPQLGTIQRSFGRHDVSDVRAHVGGPAAEASHALGARAYASGDQVAFAEQPDTFLIAHELAHVVQQRGGVQLSGGVGAAGDEHERHADEVAAAVVRGESAEPLLDRYAGAPAGPAIQRDPGPMSVDPGPMSVDPGPANVIEQRPDLVCEGPEPGELSAHQLDLIRAFARRAQQLIAPWAQQRNTPNLRFDDGAMRRHYQTFSRNWMTDIAAQEGDTDRPGSFETNAAARAEARRLLDAGTFRQSVREIQAFNHNALVNYADLLGLGASDALVHEYRVEVVGGVHGGVGEGVGVEATARRYEIFYENEMGMHWTAHGNAFTAGAGPGASTSPVAANIDLGGTYQGTSRFYFSSDDFDASVIYYLAGGGQALDQSVAAEALIFQNNGRRLEVHSTQVGGGDRWGTDNAGSASVMTGAGGMDVTSVERPGERLPDMEERPQAPPASGEWIPMMAVMIYFRTGEDELDDADRATIGELVQRMERYDERHPGAVFRVHCQGRASRRWRGAGDEESAVELNTALAERRAHAAQLHMARQLVAMRAEFSTGVIEVSPHYEPTTGGQTGEDPDDNRQPDRAVVIAVEYNPCGPEGRVDMGVRL